MGIRKIDTTLCNGCGICVAICPMDVLRLYSFTTDKGEVKKAYIKYIRDCQSCFLCELECPQDAIYVTPFRERRAVLPW